MPEVAVKWVENGVLAQPSIAKGIDAIPASAEWAWINVVDPDAETLSALAERYGLHSLAIEDVKHRQSRPKLDIYPDVLFVAWLTPVRPKGDDMVVEELDAFIGRTFLITLQDAPSDAVNAVVADVAHSMCSGPDWLLHAIIDRLVDATMPLVDTIGEQLSEIEDAMLSVSPRQEELRSLHVVRRQLVRLHRIVAPERDMLRGLARESGIISSDAYRYFQDVGDHLARVLDSIETYQDVGASVMDVYLSAQNNRMNEIMKQLTVVATIFMPLTLLSGIYGMNVLAGMWPPPLAPWSFAAVVGSMLVIAVAMATYFRKKNWW